MDIALLSSEAINLLQGLISTESFSRQEDSTANIIESFLSKKKVEVLRLKNNVWAKSKYFDSQKPAILLNSHHDTVKPNPGYTRNPFEATIEEGKLYGLGSNDAGGCLVSLLATFLYYYERTDLKYNLVFAATAEEEISEEWHRKCPAFFTKDRPGDCGRTNIDEPGHRRERLAGTGLYSNR